MTDSDLSPELREILQRTLDQVESGELQLVHAGARLTHLNFHPDYDAITDERIIRVIADLGPDLEIPDGPPQPLWDEIESLLRDALGER